MPGAMAAAADSLMPLVGAGSGRRPARLHQGTGRRQAGEGGRAHRAAAGGGQGRELAVCPGFTPRTPHAERD